MKRAIIFDSKTGTTEKCAELLAKELDNVEVFDIKKTIPKVEDYDVIIFGGAYYAGSFTSKLRKFIKQNETKLLDKKVAFFVCCAGEDTYRKVLTKNIGEGLTQKAVATDCFGYETNLDKAQGFFNKFVIKMMIKFLTKTNAPLNIIHQDRIDAFAKKIIEI